MYMRCTVLACNSGGPLESIVSGVTGYLLPPDPEAWANQITECVNKKELDTGAAGR